jgi:hypothetical protein
VDIPRGRQLKRYSVIAITPSYVFALSYNAITLWRKVIASLSYRSEHIGVIIAYNSYRCKLICRSAFLLLLVIAFPYLDMLLNFTNFFYTELKGDFKFVSPNKLVITCNMHIQNKIIEVI